MSNAARQAKTESRVGLTTAIFNPALLRKEDLVRAFVARTDLLDRLLDDIRRVAPGIPPQHQIVIGQRGLGKTTLLRRLAFAIEDDPQLSALWIPLVFPEEQYNVKNLGDFWLNCVDALSDALDRTGDGQAALALDEKVARVPPEPERRSAAALAVLVDEAVRLGRGLVLLVDNMDIVLDRLDQKEEWEFRRVTSAESRLYFVGASSRALEALYEHGRALYDYLHVHDLKGLTDPEMFALLQKLAEEAGDKDVLHLIEDQPGRVRALRVLTAGNPRTMMLLYRVLSEGPEGDVERDVEQLLDLYTPLYKARFEEMAPQAQQVVDAMAIHWDPITAGDLAEKLAPLPVNQVSAQLKRLEDFGVIEKTPWFGEKKAAFQIAERFFNIWYLMRASRRVRRRLIWLVKFLEAWFEHEELAAQARRYLQRDPEVVGPERYAEMALAYSQTVEDRHLRHNLESAGLRAALDANVRDLFDFSDLPPELKDRKERMERLRDLRERVLAIQVEGVDSRDLWSLLGGAPHLLLEEKTKIVNELPSMETADVQLLRAKLSSVEKQLVARGADSGEVVRLYEALGNGDMADVYDMDGALAVASRWQCRSLPVFGIWARIYLLFVRYKLPPPELDRAEHALSLLAAEPDYAAQAWNALGFLLRDHCSRYEQAEQAFRRAIDVDPQSAYPWNNLGVLLQDRLGRYEEAEEAYRRAIELDPKNAYPWNGLGHLLHYRLDRYRDAEHAYRQAIESDPHYAIPWNGLGNLLRDHLGRFEEAEQSYRRAVELDALSPHPWGNLARLLESRHEREGEALTAYVKAAELDPSNEGRKSKALRVATSDGIENRLPETLDAVTQLHDKFPEDIRIEFVLAGVLALSGAWARAKGFIENLASKEAIEPDVWAVGAIVRSGHLEDLLAILDRSSARDLWRPLYEALQAIRAGTSKYLRRIAPEIRAISESILDEVAPDLPDQ